MPYIDSDSTIIVVHSNEEEHQLQPIDSPKEWQKLRVCEILWMDGLWHIYEGCKVVFYSYNVSDEGVSGDCRVEWNGGGIEDGNVIDTQWRTSSRKRKRPPLSVEDYMDANAKRMSTIIEEKENSPSKDMPTTNKMMRLQSPESSQRDIVPCPQVSQVSSDSGTKSPIAAAKKHTAIHKNRKRSKGSIGGVRFIGRRIAKRFTYGKIYFGTVKLYFEAHHLWNIMYDDNDKEDLNLNQLSCAMRLYELKNVFDKNSSNDDSSADILSDDTLECNSDGVDECDKQHNLEPVSPPSDQGIEILWKAKILPFNLSKDIWTLSDPNEVTFYDWSKTNGDEDGSCTVSSRPFHNVLIKTTWRICQRRRGRGQINIFTPPLNSFKSTRRRCNTPDNYVSPSKNDLKFLELCSGSAVLSKALKLHGVSCTTLDHDPNKDADFVLSLGQLRKSIKKKSIRRGLRDEYNYIHAAPCCRTFSFAAGGTHRDMNNVHGFSPCAMTANQEIADLIYILRHYQKLNSNVIITIENPVGYLMKTKYSNILKKELGLKLVMVSYCKFFGSGNEDKHATLPRKNTCIWTNSKRLLYMFDNECMKCRNDCACMSRDGKTHKKNVYDFSDRMSSYPWPFCTTMALQVVTEMNVMHR